MDRCLLATVSSIASSVAAMKEVMRMLRQDSWLRYRKYYDVHVDLMFPSEQDRFTCVGTVCYLYGSFTLTLPLSRT